MSPREARYLHGHGSLVRGGHIALQHVGYSIIEQQDGSLTGYVHGDANALKGLGSAGQALVLVLDDGVHLQIVLTQRRPDHLMWWFQGVGGPHP
jgi:hypothetical protein